MGTYTNVSRLLHACNPTTRIWIRGRRFCIAIWPVRDSFLCAPALRIWAPEKWIQFSQPDRVAHTSAPNHRSRSQRLRFLISQVTANQRTKNSWA